MTRILVGTEGFIDPSGRMIAPGVLTMSTDTIPVVVGNVENHVEVGTAKDFTRESLSGFVYMDVTLHEKFEPRFDEEPGKINLDDYDAGLYMAPVFQHEEVDDKGKKYDLITGGTVRSLLLYPKPAIPKDVDWDRNSVTHLREVMPGEPGYVKKEGPEREPYKQKYTTVRELIAKLQRLDQTLVVGVSDSEYGKEFDLEVYVEKFEPDSWYAEENPNIKPGHIVVIHG